MALEWCLKNLPDPSTLRISLFSDSELVVRQLNGLYKTKATGLKELGKKVRKLCTGFAL